MDWRYNTIWFEQIAPEKVSIFKCGKKRPEDFGELEYITLWNYKQRNGSLDELPSTRLAMYLEINLGGTRSLKGIGRLSSLRRLEVHHCTKLESDIGLAEIAGTLRHLHFSTCRKFVIQNEILQLKQLETLRLNDCGDIESLDFLHLFPNLIDFRFVNTNIKSGDLTPIIEHKNIKSVGFMDKRHYNFKAKDIDAALATRYPSPYLEYAHKGQWSTFRYTQSQLS